MRIKFTCPACTSTADKLSTNSFMIYECPVCGRFELPDQSELCGINRNHLAAYLVYHAFKNNNHKSIIENRYHTTRSKEECDKCCKELEDQGLQGGYPVHMDNDIIEAWYPKSFSERIDQILLYVASHTEHIGQPLQLDANHILSVLFIDVQEFDNYPTSPTQGTWIRRDQNEILREAGYMLDYLKQQDYIDIGKFIGQDIVLKPKGYARVDELQKNTANGRNVLVAMSFNQTEILREAIRKGINQAGYNAIFIDEVQHNDFITPELLKYIKDSKFVVVDLTHQNNGAYFEEGYAMGLGKPVIQLCKHDVKLHFDVAQKNTIMWESEDDIPEKLCNRIKATID